MHVVFVHQNFPAQFGHIAGALVRAGWECTFVTEKEPGTESGIQKVQYLPDGEVTDRSYLVARPFEVDLRKAVGVYRALAPLRGVLEPDLIVGHSGLGPTILLPELFPDTPIVTYFEYYYHARNSDIDFRPEFPPMKAHVIRTPAKNTSFLLDLEACAAGYSPTEFQRGLFPAEYRPKIRLIHDGIPTDFWRREEGAERAVAGRRFGPETRIVTYVSRGMELMRGFDVFMRVAKRIYTARDDVVFLVIGEDRVAYGPDLQFTRGKTFKTWVLEQDDYDLDKILFLGRIEPRELRRALSLSDLHVYLTVPFVLSWSLLDAMACGCTVLGSDTAPVREVIADGDNGLLRPFHDEAALASAALGVLERPEAYRHLGEAAARTVRGRYSLAVNLPRLVGLFRQVAERRGPPD